MIVAARTANGLAKTTGHPPIPTLDEILAADPEEFVAKYTDIAAINLACAVGLPKAEDLDIPKALAVLEAMALWVQQKTARSWHLFDTYPDQYRHSKNIFRVVFRMHQLHHQFGVHYNPERLNLPLKDDPANDAGNEFILGILSPRRTGTCASLPYFAVAVGRRLGYPLKLVKVPSHLLFRWDDGIERCNFEFNDGPGAMHPDGYYRTWPVRWDARMYAEQARYQYWLNSLTPREEVATCLAARFNVLEETQRYQESLNCLDTAQRFDPTRTVPYQAARRTILQKMLLKRGSRALQLLKLQKQPYSEGCLEGFLEKLAPKLLVL